MNKEIIILMTLVSVLLASGSVYAQTISVSPNIPSTNPGTIATFTVSISGNPVEMDAIGFGITYNTSVLQIQDVSRGVLTQGWSVFEWNEIVPGGVIVGGVRLSDPPIPPQSSGSIAIISMMVVCNGCTIGELGQFCISKYDVELDIFTPQPICIQQFDFCTEDIRGPFYTEWSNCSLKDDQFRLKYYLDLNNESCCGITGLDEDCHIKTEPYEQVIEYQYCDYCTPNWVEVNHSAGCSPQDTIHVTHNDTNMCYQKTLLPSDWDSRPEDKIYSCDYCTPSWTCDGYGACQPDDKRYCNSAWDTKNCYSQTWLDSDKYHGDYSEFSPIVCDYCIPNWVEVNTKCNSDDTVTGYYMDSNDCFAKTGLSSDLQGRPGNNTYACDYCTPNWMETNTTCNTDDTITGYYVDANGCYSQTGLNSDNNPPENNTYLCDFCTPEWECVSHGPCQPNNIQVCDGVSDVNGCYAQTGLVSDEYQGNYLEFNQSCQYTNYTGPEWFNTTANQAITIDAVDESDASVEILSLSDTFNNFINITKHTENPENETVLGLIPLGKYIDIEVVGEVENSLGWVVIRVYYTNEEVSGAGIDEGSLSIYIWNESEGEWEVIENSGVNTDNNYVWANMTHFSLYGLYGELAPYCGDGSCNNGETCSSCTSDCGSCPPPPPSGPTGGFVTIGSPPPSLCTEDWSCTAWSECIDDKQTRTCVDLNDCNTTENKPTETWSCKIILPEEGACAQVITPAVSPTGECKEFLSPCDVPEGWSIIAACPPAAGEQGDSVGILTGIEIITIAIVIIIMVIIAGFYWSRSRKIY